MLILSDHRGHGKSVYPDYPLGYMENVDQMVSDVVQGIEKMKDKYPNNSLYLFGHSLGSVFARCYLQKHGHNIEKLTLSVTVNYVPGVSVGIMFVKIVII